VAKEVVVATLSQTYGLDEEASEEPAEPTTFLQDLGGIGSGFLSAAWNAIKAIPGIVGINLAGAEEETDETALSAAITDGFNASSGGHGAAAALAYLVFGCSTPLHGRRGRRAAGIGA
jgi:ferrous iron transport protein B